MKQAIACIESMSLKLRAETWDGECFFLYTHVNKTQEFNRKINVILINLEANMGMNLNNHLHYG
jgi:hypothetical protein